MAGQRLERELEALNKWKAENEQWKAEQEQRTALLEQMVTDVLRRKPDAMVDTATFDQTWHDSLQDALDLLPDPTPSKGVNAQTRVAYVQARRVADDTTRELLPITMHDGELYIEHRQRVSPSVGFYGGRNATIYLVDRETGEVFGKNHNDGNEFPWDTKIQHLEFGDLVPINEGDLEWSADLPEISEGSGNVAWWAMRVPGRPGVVDVGTVSVTDEGRYFSIRGESAASSFGSWFDLDKPRVGLFELFELAPVSIDWPVS